MSANRQFTDAFGRIHDQVHAVLEGIAPDDLLYQVDEASNPVGWLIWHLARVQDDHVADLADMPQIWTSKDWSTRFDLPYKDEAVGYGQSAQEVRAFHVNDAALLASYYDDVNRQTLDVVATLKESDLTRVVDDAWDPPVTLEVRLVSVISDDLQHVGQAAYVRGIAERRRSGS